MANYRYTYESGGYRYVIEAPDGATPADLQAIVDGTGRAAALPPPAAKPKPKPKKKEDESFLSGFIPTLKSAAGRSLSEIGALVDQFSRTGFISSASLLGGVNPTPGDNILTRPVKQAATATQNLGRDIRTKAEAELPASSIADRLRQQAEIKNAKPGTGSEILAGLGRAASRYTDLYYPQLSGVTRDVLPQTAEQAAPVLAKVQAPFGTARGTSEFVASQIPSLLPVFGGKAVQIGARALPRLGVNVSEAALAQGINRGVVATGTAMNAASAGNQAYEDVLAAGGTQEEADRAFKIAAAGAAAVSAAATKIPGIEQLAFAEKPAKGGILRSAGRAVIGEAPQEFVEEGGAALATNVGKLGTAAEGPIGEDVLSSGILGGIGGGILAAPIGGLQGVFSGRDTGPTSPTSGAAQAPRTPPPPPPPPPPPADMEALAKALGPVGGKVILQEPTGPQEYTFEGFDEDGGVVLSDADGVIFSEDPDQIQAAIKAGVAEPESGLGGMAFGMDITEGLDNVFAPPPPPPPPAAPVAPTEKPKFTIETAEETAAREAKDAIKSGAVAPPVFSPDVAPPIFSPPAGKPKFTIETAEEEAARLAGVPNVPYISVNLPPQQQPTILPIDEDVEPYMQEYAATRTPSQMRQVEDSARQIAAERGATSVSKEDMLQAGMAFDDAFFKTTPSAPKQKFTIETPPPSPKNTQGKSQVGKVIFDQESGVGQVPLNQNVKYRGFTAMMRPSKFLELAADLENPKQSSVEYIRKAIDQGRGVGSPFLNLDFETGKVASHDGRHRMLAILEKNGDAPVPVHIFGKGEQRARSLDEGKISSFASSMTGEDGRQSTDNFSEAFLDEAAVPVSAPAAAAPEPVAPPAAPRAIGKTARATIPATREKVDVQYELQDLGNIKFAQDELQNRDRSRPSSTAFIADFVNNFDPDGLGEDNSTDRGAPIINKDNIILSGNGRTMGLEEIYGFNPKQAERYQESLRELGYDIEGMDRPVLVRRLMSDVDERKFVTASNESDVAALSPPEQAAQDASDILTPGVFAKFKGGDLNSAKNDAFVSAFLAEMNPQQRKNAMDDKGKVSSQALKRIENALLYKAYGNSGRASKIFMSKAMERNDDDTKTLTNSLVDVASDWIKFQQAIEAGEVDKKYNITNKIMEMVGTVSDIKASGSNVANELRSPDMVEPMDPFVRDILMSFHDDKTFRILSKKAIAEKLRAYTEVAAVQQPEPDMFGKAETPTARDIWKRIDSGEGAPQSNLFASIEAPSGTLQQDIEEIRKVPSLKRGLAKLIKYKDEQLIDDAEFAKQVTDLKDYVDYMQDEKNYRLAGKGRARGADRVLSALLNARRTGVIDPDSVDFMMWSLDANPNLADGLAISIVKPKENSPAGDYNPVMRVMRLFKNSASDTTAVHELLHHTERMMPADIQGAIRTTWLREFNKQAEKSKGNILEKEFFKHLRSFHSGSPIKMGKETYPPKKGMELALNSISNGFVPYSFYQYVNPSEFWAVNATEIMQKRFDVSDSIVGRLRNWLSEFVERAKGLFNLSAKSPLLKALDSLAKADGKFNSKAMLSEDSERYMDVTPISDARNRSILTKAQEVVDKGSQAKLREVEDTLDALDDVYSSDDENAKKEADRLEESLYNMERQIREKSRPSNDNKLETEVEKAKREYDKASKALNKIFYEDERALKDRRTKERKAYEKELEPIEKAYQEAVAKWDKLYRQETEEMMKALTNGTAAQMRNAVAKAQEPNDKIIDEGADLQKDNRGCD